MKPKERISEHGGNPAVRKQRALDSESELEIINRAKGGDVLAMDLLLDRYRSFAWKVARRSCRVKHEQEDCFQVANIYMIQAIRRYNPSLGANLLTYFFNSVARQMRSEWEKRCGKCPHKMWSRMQSLDVQINERGDTLASKIPDTTAGEDPRVGPALKAIRELSEKEQQVLFGRMDGKSTSDIAVLIGEPVQSIASIEISAHEKVRRALGVSRITHVRQADRWASQVEDLRERLPLGEHLLTPRESQIASLCCDGLSQYEIAQHIGVSRTRVWQQFRNLWEKLSRVTAIRVGSLA